MDMSWKPEVDELKKRGAFAEELGGKKGRDYQHSIGKNTARERIELLLDKSSFREMGKIAGKANYDDAGNEEDDENNVDVFTSKTSISNGPSCSTKLC